MHNADFIEHIENKVDAAERLTAEEGLRLYKADSPHGLGRLAARVRERLNGNDAYYIVNRHINYTNICVNGCRFCAFSKKPGEPGGHTMSLDEVFERAAPAASDGSTELHIVGGVDPELPLAYYIDMIAGLRERHPGICIQAFTAAEIAHLADASQMTDAQVLAKLKDAGLTALPGGGAEVFSTRVRQLLCPSKISADRWLSVSRHAHRLGIPTNATMLYGHVETLEERIDHLVRLREAQDETGGFMCFIPLPFHPENTAMTDITRTSAIDDLKTFATARLMLDNFPHIKAFWIMTGVKLAQVALAYGADDMNGTVIEERITHAAGAETPQRLTVGEIRRLILEAGRTPVERDTLYNRISDRA
jgi:aminodeoxyfutalosine synthase